METSVFMQPSTVFTVVKFKEQHFSPLQEHPETISNQLKIKLSPKVLHFSMKFITVLILTWKEPVT